MDNATKDALESSIVVWEKKRDATDPNEIGLGPWTCPLCTLFNTASHITPVNRCMGCPVFERTGKKFCENTPYANMAMALASVRNAHAKLETPSNALSCSMAREVAWNEWRARANKQVQFLKSLRGEN